MQFPSKLQCAAMLGLLLAKTDAFAATAGTARLETTILDYTGSSGTRHWTVAWVTTSSGTFIKTLRLQGPTITASHWNSHCGQWYSARAGSTALDGYTSATAANYTGTNSPVILTWNCRDANNNLVADGAYKFWVQYAEDSGQGPYTASGLLWTKGPNAVTNTYPNQGASFSSMRVAWTPAAPPTVAPTITSAAPSANGTVGVAYSFTSTATGTAPISFTAAGLPTGLTISTAGIISGTPTVADTFNGTITAANGTPPNATQPFSFSVSTVPVCIASARMDGNNLILSGSGPPNGTFAVMISTNLSLSVAQWTPLATNSIDATGNFGSTNALDLNVPNQFFQLRMP